MGKHTLIIEGDTLEDIASSVAEAHEKLNAPPAAVAAATSESPKSPKSKTTKKAETGCSTRRARSGRGRPPRWQRSRAGARARRRGRPHPQRSPSRSQEVAEGSGGVPAAKKILAKFKAAKTTNLKEGDYAAFVKACKAAVK
jgi:hypothetical protein